MLCKFLAGILSCTVSCWNKCANNAVLTSTAVRDVVSDMSVWQLLLHLLLNSKQTLTSVHLCCHSFGVCHVKASSHLFWDTSKTSLFDSSCQSFDPEGEHSRRNNISTVLCLTTYTSIAINTPLYYQSKVHHCLPSERPTTKFVLLCYSNWAHWSMKNKCLCSCAFSVIIILEDKMFSSITGLEFLIRPKWRG